MGRATAHFRPSPLGPGEGSKGQISFIFNNKVNCKIFIPNFVYVLTNKIYKSYPTGFSFYRLSHALWVGLGGSGGGGGGVKKYQCFIKKNLVCMCIVLFDLVDDLR